MTFRIRAGVVSFLSILVAALCLVTAAPRPVGQTAAPAQPDILAKAEAQAKALGLAQPIPADPLVTVGRLPNGLRYYIRANKRPEKRAELRLAVNAGSVLEDKDQLGLAHFTEHMAFNGSRNFPGQEMIRFMESIGMRAGPSINAYTSFDETVYLLQVPTDRPEVMEKAFTVLEDWAHNLTLDPKEIDKERGVIVEEWRLGRGAGARMRDKYFPVLLKGSLYADRLPIGTKESIETFAHAALTRFYKDWYRPDLMAVVAVGDFDKASIEALLKTHFAPIPAVKTPRLRPVPGVPPHPSTLYAVATDKEATNTSITIYNKMAARDPSTTGAYRQEIVESLAGSMFSNRLADIARSPDAPFVMASAMVGNFVRTMSAAFLSAAPKAGSEEKSIEALLVEANRVSRFGFVSTELDRTKRSRLRAYERYFAEREKTESSALADEFARNFLEKEAIPGPAMEYALNRRFLPEITLAEVNAVAKDWLAESSRVVVLTAPEKAGVAVPDEAKLAAAVKNAGLRDVTAYNDNAGNRALIDTPPEPGKVVKTTSKEQYGITEWDLSNGVKVVLKPTDYKEDEIVFRATSPGGTSLATDQDYVPASTAAMVLSRNVTGLGAFSAIDLRKVLAGKIASATPIIGELEEGVIGSGSPKDMETMFQLIYLTMTAPRTDGPAFTAFTTQGRTVLANQQASPAYAFAQAMNSAMTQDHPRGRMLSLETIDEMNMERSLAVYKDRFADASDFTFVFVGAFTLDAVRPFVETYLASLPSLHRTETWRDVGKRYPTGVVAREVKKGMEPQSQVAIAFTGPFEYDREHRVAIRALELVLGTKLRETLREDMSGTYGIAAMAGYAVIPRKEYTFQIRWGCNPQRVDELVKAVFQEIDTLKKNGPTEKQTSDAREALLRELETNMKQNSYLLGQIYLRYQVPQDLGEFFDLAEYYKTVNARMIWDAAKKYLNQENYVKVTLLPEAKTEAAPVTKKLEPVTMPLFERPAA